MKLSTINYQLSTGQHGVTLLISVLVLASVSLITLTIGSFAISELRSSRAVALSEPAITAAEAAAEEGIYSLKRGGSIPNCSGSKKTATLTDSRTTTSQCIFYSSATFEIRQQAPLSFYLYDPNNINGNLQPGYNYLVVTNKSSRFTVFVSVATVDGQLFIANQAINPGGVATIPNSQNLPAISPGTDERYRVTLTANGNVTVDVTTNLGLPDYPTVDAEGCSTPANLSSCDTASEAFKRRLNVLVPQ